MTLDQGDFLIINTEDGRYWTTSHSLEGFKLMNCLSPIKTNGPFFLFSI